MSKIDENRQNVALVQDTNGEVASLLVDPITGYLLVDILKDSEGGETVNTSKIDENNEATAIGKGGDTTTPLHIDNNTGRLTCNLE